MLENQHWLRMKINEGFYDGEKLYPLLVQQHHVSRLPGVLLSPRSHRMEICLDVARSDYFLVPFCPLFPFLFPCYLTLI